jgi:hypothetical protein
VGDRLAQQSFSLVLNVCSVGPSHAALQDANPQPASPANNWNCCNRYHVDAFLYWSRASGAPIMKTESVTVWNSADIQNLPGDSETVTGANLSDHLLLELLAKCHQLRSINLMGSEELTDASLTQLAAERNLREIDLGLCHMMSDLTPEALAGLPQLKTLSLAWCYSITDASLLSLARSKTLAKLLLGGCEKLTDEGVCALAGMPNLEWLELPEFGAITDVAIAALACAPKLSTLRLSNLQSVTDAGMMALQAATSLHTLRIDGASSVTMGGIEKLHESLPACRIKYGSWESPSVAPI